MKRMLAAAIALIVLLSACSAPRDEGSATVESAAPAEQLQPEQTPADFSGQTSDPLALSRDVRAYGDGYIVYPRVFGSSAELINADLYNAVAERTEAERIDRAIFSDYRVEYNDDGLFSVLIYVRDFETDELLLLVPLTYDATSGARLRITDLRDKEDDTWRRVLPEIVTEQAAKKNMTLLSDLLPVADGQGFYITAYSLVLVYKLYEIATYSAGMPEFSISYSRISQYFGEDSPLQRTIGEAGGKNE